MVKALAKAKETIRDAGERLLYTGLEFRVSRAKCRAYKSTLGCSSHLRPLQGTASGGTPTVVFLLCRAQYVPLASPAWPAEDELNHLQKREGSP